MKEIDIELKIRETVQLYGKSAKGWESCIHNTCDHGKKGPRAAFLFSPNTITFNCFNCSSAAVLDLAETTIMPKKFQAIMEDFGMDRKTINEINFHLFSKNGFGSNYKDEPEKKPEPIIPKPIDLPSDFVLLDEYKNTEVGEMALQELARRKINPDDYPFLICIKGGHKTRKKWEKRLIIPVFKGNDVVFYQGQDLTKEADTKYLNASDKVIDRSKIISNYDVLFEKSDDPIYVVEGWYDAYHIKGVAVYGNQIKDNQVAWLNKSYREKVYIPDRYGDGADIALDALKRGWKVAVPYERLDSNVKDISDMIASYGVLFTMKRIRESTSTSELDAKTKIRHLAT